jgi:hypothetical protein
MVSLPPICGYFHGDGASDRNSETKNATKWNGKVRRFHVGKKNAKMCFDFWTFFFLFQKNW